MKLLQEMMSLSEAKVVASHAEKFSALKKGDRPDDKTKAALEKMCDRAEKAMLKAVLKNPDQWSIDTYDNSNADIRDGVGIWAKRVDVHENGFSIDLNVDADDLGGDITNYEAQFADTSGKILDEEPSLGALICTLVIQDDYMCERVKKD